MHIVTESNADKQRLFYIGALAGALMLVLAACKGDGYGGAYGGGAGGAYGARSSSANAAPAAPAPANTPAPATTAAMPSVSVADQPAVIKLVNFEFTPAQLTVKVGTTVVWTSEDNAPHTVTANDGSFDSGNLQKGDSFKFTFTMAGKFPYYCAYHGTAGGGGMSGTITVTN
jgi:plastocyanin